MGLPIDVSLIVIELTNKINKGKVLCLGKQVLGFKVRDLINSKSNFRHNIDISVFDKIDLDIELTQELFFNTLGFKHVDTLDVDEYEGANIIFDLNQENIPEKLTNTYDFIYDGGTLEHVFNIGTALKSLSIFLKRDGVICHMNPCNGYIDHAFFQISPTLYFDYYLQNNFKILSSVIMEKSIGSKTLNISQDLYRTYSPDFGIQKAIKGWIIFSAKKQNDSLIFINPQQGYYLAKWESDKQKFYLVEKKFNFGNYFILRRLFYFIFNFPFLLKRTIIKWIK